MALEGESARLKEEQSVCSGQLTEKIRQVDEYDEEYKGREHVINELRLKENEFKIKITDLEERIHDDYQVELSGVCYGAWRRRCRVSGLGECIPGD